MPILIDGHNLIGRMPSLSLRDPDDEERLVALLQSYRGRSGKKITVVFDPGPAYSSPQTRRQGGIEVVFAAHGSSADDVILRRVRHARDRAGLIVVTSDRALARAVAQYGARVRPAEDMARALSNPAATAEQDVSMSAEELEAWLALFDARE
jgi:hypothetical protein